MDNPLPAEVRIGDRISAILAERGKTFAWLADETGVHKSTVTRIVNGSRSPKPETLFDIATGLGMSIEHLVAGTDAADRVDKARRMVPQSQYEELLHQMATFEQEATEARVRARRSEENAQRERDERIRCQAESQALFQQQREKIERLERERDDALELTLESRQEADRYRKSVEEAVSEIEALRSEIEELAEALDDSRMTGKVTAILAGTATVASLLTLRNVTSD